MKYFILAFMFGLFIGWLTVPLVRATIPVEDSIDARDHSYKWALNEMLNYMRQMNNSLQSIDTNIKAVKDKLHA